LKVSERQIRRARERTAERETRRSKRLGRKVALASGAALGATVLFAPAAQADTFTVTSTDDDGDEGTLREEIEDANDNPGDDVIAFASNVTGTITLTDGDIEIYYDALDIQGPGADVLEVVSEDSRIFQLYDFDSDGEQNSVSGLTLTGDTGGNGGAIDSDDQGSFGASLALDGMVIRDSYSGEDGGAVRFDAEEYGDTLTITNSVIANNDALDNGGGLYSVDGNVTISGSTISGNEAVNGVGGGAFTDDGSLTIVNSLLSENQSDSGGNGNYGGGAVFVEETYDEDNETGTEVLVQSTAFLGNYSDDYGGALYLSQPDGDIVITGSTFADNEAANGAGGVYVQETYFGSDLTISSSTFSGNDAGVDADNDGGYGGGALIDAVDGDTLIENSTFSGNTASYSGGGIHFWYLNEDQTTTIQNSTIVDNAAALNPADYSGPYGGGGIYLYDDVDSTDENGPVILSSTIVANNSAEEGPDLGSGEFADGFDAGFSLIESTDGARDPQQAEINEDPAGSNLFGVDPLLGPLAANGGPTQTHAPALTSPVLDAGIANGLAQDQRGRARTSDLALVPNRPGSDATDIGSVEIQAGDVEAQCQDTVVRKLNGTSGDDTITGTGAAEAIFGLAGADTLNGAGGNDCVSGDQGRDNARGGPGADIVEGGAGKDRAAGGGGKDNVKGGGGKDRASGGGGKDKVKGQGGKDRLKGGGKKDRLAGQKGKDNLKGGGGKDRLKGGPGKDKLAGGGGRDRLNCGGGNDKATAQPNDRVSANCEQVVEAG
jgi:RTX calcium-binding nonapeptide repeat (4 copies)